MDPQKLTVMSRQAITDAQNDARRRQHNEVETWHLLQALLTQENGLVSALVEKLGLTSNALQLAVERELDRLPRVSGSVDVSKIYVTQAVNEVLVPYLNHRFTAQDVSFNLLRLDAQDDQSEAAARMVFALTSGLMDALRGQLLNLTGCAGRTRAQSRAAL